MNSLVSGSEFRNWPLRRSLALIAASLLVLVCPAVSPAQLTPNNDQPATRQADRDPVILRWKIHVGALAQESRTAFPDALVLFAKKNPDEATRTAEEIGDKITKIRALALIARIALHDLVEAEREPK